MVWIRFLIVRCRWVHAKPKHITTLNIVWIQYQTRCSIFFSSRSYNHIWMLSSFSLRFAHMQLTSQIFIYFLWTSSNPLSPAHLPYFIAMNMKKQLERNWWFMNVRQQKRLTFFSPRLSNSFHYATAHENLTRKTCCRKRSFSSKQLRNRECLINQERQKGATINKEMPFPNSYALFSLKNHRVPSSHTLPLTRSRWLSLHCTDKTLGEVQCLSAEIQKREQRGSCNRVQTRSFTVLLCLHGYIFNVFCSFLLLPLQQLIRISCCHHELLKLQ